MIDKTMRNKLTIIQREGDKEFEEGMRILVCHEIEIYSF